MSSFKWLDDAPSPEPFFLFSNSRNLLREEEIRDRMRLRDVEKRRRDQETNAKPNRGIASEKELGEENLGW